MQKEAKIFKALADETRLRILALLLEGEMCVCEIIAALELPQSTISRHLAYLRNSDWVLGRRQGGWMYYRLNEGGHSLLDEMKPVLVRQLTKDPRHDESLSRVRGFLKDQKQKVC
jgi:ArsR family transcriptional regulator